MRSARFPKRIKRGSCVVTIYKTPTKGYDSFTLVHYDAKGTRANSRLKTSTLAQTQVKIALPPRCFGCQLQRRCGVRLRAAQFELRMPISLNMNLPQ